MKGVRTRSALAVTCSAILLLVGSTKAEEIEQVRAFYFGNSFTGNTMPGLHPLLGESAGKEWSVGASTAPGVPIWAHMKRQMDKGREYEKFQSVGAETDAIVMLLFGGDGLSCVVTEKWQGKVKFDRPTDIGDVAACTYLIREYLKLNPDGRAYVYTAWPYIPEVRELRDRIREEAIKSAMRSGESRREVMKRIKTRKPNHEEMEPLRKSFDYAVHWLTDDYVPNVSAETRDRFNAYSRLLRTAAGRRQADVLTRQDLAAAAGVDGVQVRSDLDTVGHGDNPLEPRALLDTVQAFLSNSRRTHCRKHMYLAMEGLKKNFPKLWEEGRLGMIPVGDVFLELDKKMKAGEVPGIVNVGEFSADGGHLRSGLPRYTLAATYYAVLFRAHPGELDWKIFQDRSNYESGRYGFYVHQPDLAVHLDITPERAKIVNDTIWEVVKDHPYTALMGIGTF